MSRFSGKFDFYDEIEINGLDLILNSQVFVGDSLTPLRLTCREDCIPYYPYVPVMAGVDQARGRGTFYLTAKPWPEIQAERYGIDPSHYRQELEWELGKHRPPPEQNP